MLVKNMGVSPAACLSAWSMHLQHAILCQSMVSSHATTLAKQCHLSANFCICIVLASNGPVGNNRGRNIPEMDGGYDNYSDEEDSKEIYWKL